MVKIYYRDVKGGKLRTLDSFKPGCWIYVDAPSGREIRNLVKEFNLEEGLLRDAIDIYEVPRMEVERGVNYIFTRFAYWQSPKLQLTAINEASPISTEPLLIAVGENFLMTLSVSPLPFMDKFLEGKIDFYTTQKAKLFLQIFTEINLVYNSFLHNISKQIRSTTILLERINNKDIIQFVTFENVLNDFLSALVPTSTILKNLMSGKYLKLYEGDKDLIEDLSLNNDQLVELSQANLRTLVNIREAYSTIMTNNLNRVIRLLTSLTVILMVPNLIASIYGMNIILPLAESPQAFSNILSLIVALVAILLVVFFKNRWL